MHPAQQGLRSDNPPVFDLRLIPQRELLFADASVNLLFKRSAQIDRGLEGRGKEAKGIAPGGLRLVHGDIGLLQNLAGALFAFPEYGDSDARRAQTFMLIQHVWLGRLGEYFFRNGLGLGRGFFGIRAEVLDDDDEFVASDPRRGVALAKAEYEAPSHFLQQQVAGVVAEGIVEGFEIVQVDEQQRTLAAVSPARSK